MTPAAALLTFAGTLYAILGMVWCVITRPGE
jgi:hypothetical protein